MKHALILSILLIMIHLQGAAGDSVAMKTRPVQVSFITPAGSNGIHSGQFINNFSLNILVGYAGGLKGAEFSGLTSVLGNDMEGFQAAGLANVVGGKVRGAQFAGLANVVGGVSQGFQAAGLVNVSAGGKLTQAAGLMNINAGNDHGMQIGGLGNVNTGTINGVQLAGLFNYTNKLSGVQLGVFNFADTIISGTPIGFLSFVAHGYYAFEIAASETFYGTISFKTGTRKFYNILSTGMAVRNDKIIWGWGYGIGTLVAMTPKLDLGMELIAYHVNEDEWFTKRLNFLNKFNMFVNWNVLPNLTLFAGPSWNVTVTDTYDGEGGTLEPNIAPWTVYDETYSNDINVTMYPGFNLGIKF